MGVPATTGVLRTNIKDMEIGDYIAGLWFEGKSISSSEGLNLSVAIYPNTNWEEIPYNGIELTSGKGMFYFIKVAKGLLVSDRVVQVNYSWEKLNNQKLIEGVSSQGGIFRSFTGGVAYADANGKSTSDKVDLGFGTFPSNNEWDRYVVNFPVDKIQNGKTLDDVFHWNSGVYTWCQDTPINAITTNTYRIGRGRDSLSKMVSDPSSTIGVWLGFRPVFEYNENQ